MVYLPKNAQRKREDTEEEFIEVGIEESGHLENLIPEPDATNNYQESSDAQYRVGDTTEEQYNNNQQDDDFIYENIEEVLEDLVDHEEVS